MQIGFARVRSFVLFMLASLGTFWLAFGTVGRFISDLVISPFAWSPPGLLGALWTMFLMLLSLLPQLVILFSFFYFVEKNSPQSWSRIVMGLGCGTVAAGTLTGLRRSERARTAVLLSFVPCSAQMPVVLMLLGGVLKLNFAVIFLFYAGAIGFGFLVQRFLYGSFKNRMACGEDLTDKQADARKSFFVSVAGDTLRFFERISGTVLLAAAILYLVSNYNFSLAQVPTRDSMLIQICNLVQVVFVPLGFNGAIIAVLVFGILGKEMSAAAILLLSPFDTVASVVTFLIFFMLYPPCIANVKAIASVTDRRTASVVVLSNLAAAYLAAFAFYTLYLIVI